MKFKLCWPWLLGKTVPGRGPGIFWVAVKELKLSYYIGETIPLTLYIYIEIYIYIHTHHGNFVQVP